MPTYTLMGDYPMKCGGRHVQPGKTVKMSEEEAEQYVKSGRLKECEAKPQLTATDSQAATGGDSGAGTAAGAKKAETPAKKAAEKVADKPAAKTDDGKPAKTNKNP